MCGPPFWFNFPNPSLVKYLILDVVGGLITLLTFYWGCRWVRVYPMICVTLDGKMLGRWVIMADFTRSEVYLSLRRSLGRGGLSTRLGIC